MKDAAFRKMGYPVVSKQNPFLNVTVRDVDLTKLIPLGNGITQAKIYRTGIVEPYIYVPAVELQGNTFKFIMPALFLAFIGGRYTYELYYKGNFLGNSEFQYNKVDPTFEESLRV
jgi:hypothetical protein